MCSSVTTDLHREKRTKTYCLRGRKMCPSVATDLHTGKTAKTDCLRGSIICPSVATDIHTRKSKDWLSSRQNNVSECTD
jgi:hypothetical protein